MFACSGDTFCVYAGYKGGEVASSLAVKSVKKFVFNNFKKYRKDRESILQLLKAAIEYANMVVYDKSKEDSELQDMGTTLDACLIYNNKVFIGHVGDSRVYRIRKNFMRKRFFIKNISCKKKNKKYIFIIFKNLIKKHYLRFLRRI